MQNDKNPYIRWRHSTAYDKLDDATKIDVHRWSQAYDVMSRQFDKFDDVIEPWLKDASAEEPDLVAFIAAYGYSRLLTGDWGHLPIEIPASELDDWKENAAMFTSVDEIRSWEAGISGSVAEMLGIDTDRVVNLLLKQVGELQASIQQFKAQPVESFKPTPWEGDELVYEEAAYEKEQLDRVFNQTEKLICFQQAIEIIRSSMISDTNEKFGLPSMPFFQALMRIDSWSISQTVLDIEPKLQEILELWAGTIMPYSGKPYHRPYDATAPDVFWWRHRNKVRLPRRQSTPKRGPSGPRHK